jgi:hypothetical protein
MGTNMSFIYFQVPGGLAGKYSSLTLGQQFIWNLDGGM